MPSGALQPFYSPEYTADTNHLSSPPPAEYQPGGVDPVSSSAVPIANGEVYTPSGKAYPYGTPRALEASEIPGIVKAYADGARNALEAGLYPSSPPLLLQAVVC